jgi:hypothetical protein
MRQPDTVRSLVRLILFVLFSGSAILPARGAFSSLYAFGDGVCSSTDNADTSHYYPNTYSNGRIWLQVLAQRQGLAYDANKNKSYMWHNSTILLTDVSQFYAADATTSLFVVWVSDADFVDDMTDFYPDQLNDTTWNNAINTSLGHHSSAIEALYSTKGVRTLIMPNAVDISKIPQYAGCTASEKNFIRGKVVSFNTQFATRLNQARAAHPDLKIYSPDFFTLLDNMLANPGYYGLVNPGYSAIENLALSPWPLTGPGASYVFWDPWDPSAKAHAVMADIAQQLISPVSVSHVTALGASNRLDVVNMPIGLSGFVDGRTNPATGTWTSVTNFNSTSATQAIFVPASGPQQFYRLRFPFAWSYP